MIIPGLVSVTFRKLSPIEIVSLVRQAELNCIEWGGDIHVPHGDCARAREVGQLTRAAGLTVAAYGSYYKLNKSEADSLPFSKVLDTARALGAPTIRVWAGTRSSVQADGADRAAVAADARRIADLAQTAGITVTSEYHGGTLTDTDASAQQFLQETQHANFWTGWQPHASGTAATNLGGLQAILPRLTTVHCYHWLNNDRRPLAEGAADWRQYFTAVQSTGRLHSALLEFVVGDDPASFVRDAATLRQLVA